jgi:hypothetical protein
MDHDGFTAIAAWESPTDHLLRSPADEVLSSVPDLDPAAKELAGARLSVAGDVR